MIQLTNQTWTVSSSVDSSHLTDITCPWGWWSQNVGLRDFAIFLLCCCWGHPCFKNTCLVHFLVVSDVLAKQTIDDGQSLLDEMSRPVKNASGKDITPDYASQIKHINNWLADLQERKLRCDELADVRKLKLQQILQLRTCERDADQVRCCKLTIILSRISICDFIILYWWGINYCIPMRMPGV